MSRPIKLEKENIIGHYRIDKKFYPGKNADWQYERYSFTITPSDSIYLFVKRKDSVLHVFAKKLEYTSGPPKLWRIKSNSSFHVFKNRVTLVRGHKRFYYVFQSKYYGNMFFRKTEE
ncbi:MAG: hypothetical protein JST39_00275 [Bacteroidetes bacterium]|nr:hypothetical protein [Bacteroidota bacterium]